MLCERCGKNPATTHYQQNINGEVTEYHLCSECAKQVMDPALLNPFSQPFENLFASIFGEGLQSYTRSLPESLRCKGCGASFDDIASTGKVGCGLCYDTFFKQFEPTLQRIHSNTRHVGKIPRSAGAKFSVQNKINRLKEELKAAVDDQNFEKAAELRDKIHDLEKKVKGNE